MLNIQNVTAGYGKDPVLHDISLKIEAGKVTSLIGPNGCGKTTLLKAIAGQIPLQHGEIMSMRSDSCMAGGSDTMSSMHPDRNTSLLTDSPSSVRLDTLPATERTRLLAYLSQGRSTPDITAGRLVLHGRFPYLSYPRRYGKEDYRLAEEAMKKLDICHLKDRKLTELSGGMRQKLYIAMALAQQAPIILMDEPTTYLDAAQQKNICEMARALAAEGKTILCVMHDLPLAMRYSDSIAIMNEGRIACTGTPDDVLRSGMIEKIYGISVGSVCRDEKTHYYLEL